jgi:hypothetical protein
MRAHRGPKSSFDLPWKSPMRAESRVALPLFGTRESSKPRGAAATQVQAPMRSAPCFGDYGVRAPAGSSHGTNGRTPAARAAAQSRPVDLETSRQASFELPSELGPCSERGAAIVAPHQRCIRQLSADRKGGTPALPANKDRHDPVSPSCAGSIPTCHAPPCMKHSHDVPETNHRADDVTAPTVFAQSRDAPRTGRLRSFCNFRAS